MEHSPGKFHGYATSWKGLSNEAKAALIRAGQATQSGRIIP
jgi:hypothetical protein